MKTGIRISASHRFSSPREALQPNSPQGQSYVLPVGLFLLSSMTLWPAATAFCQSQSQSTQQSPSSEQKPSQAQAQPPAQQKDETTSDASKKPQKDKPKPKKVYTDEDLSGMRGNGVSVVGDESSPARGAAKGSSAANVAPMSGKDESYWRGRARPLLGEMDAIDQQIAKLKDDIKKYGAGGFDVTTGMKDNVAYIEDRNGQVSSLEKRKADLQKKLEDLQDEGRKAGASPAWFR